jgi:ABC-type oligopeptide transport system substrate-binding subunit
MNKHIFFDQYKRIASYFAGTELAATGLLAGRELELLEAVRDKVPPEVFTKPYTNPVNGNSEAVPMPKFGMAAFPTVWWWDVQKAAKAGLVCIAFV